MSTEKNKVIMQRYFEEAWNRGNLALLDKLIALDYINHNPAVPGLPPGPEGLKPIFIAFRQAFPDIQFTIEDQIAEGDLVVTRWTMRGTQQGELMGIPPTGKQVKVTGSETERITNGRIVEHWLTVDQLGMMQQLGVFPAPTTTS